MGRWEDQSAVYKNKLAEIWELGGPAGQSSLAVSFQNESRVSSGAGSWGEGLMG